MHFADGRGKLRMVDIQPGDMTAEQMIEGTDEKVGVFEVTKQRQVERNGNTQ